MTFIIDKVVFYFVEPRFIMVGMIGMVGPIFLCYLMNEKNGLELL